MPLATKCSAEYLAPPAPKPSVPHPQLQDSQQSLDIPDRYAEQIKLRREWEEKIGRLNEKYNLNCFSSSELDSETDSDSDYWYNHKYETLI